MGVLVFAALAGCATAPDLPNRASSGAGAAPATSARHQHLEAAATSALAAESSALTASAAGVTEPALLKGAPVRELQRGKASWYGPRFHGRRTASGERYNMHALTAAHKTLPFGTLVRVRSLLNGREVDVRINDRGPFLPGRVIDVSRSAAQALGLMELGVKDVLLLVQSSTRVAADPEL